MNYVLQLDADQLSAQIAERLDHDAIASAIDLGELVDNISVSRLSDEMYERYDIAEIAGAIDLGDVAEALYPLIINDEESLTNRIDELEQRIRLLEASVTVHTMQSAPAPQSYAVDAQSWTVTEVPWGDDEVIDLDDFNHVTVRMTIEAWEFLSETLFDHLCSDVLNSKTVTLIED